MPYEAQHPQLVKNIVLSANKQTTFGTQLADAALTQRLRPDIAGFARIMSDYYSDIEKAGKGHPWPTQRVRIARDTGFSLAGIEVDAFLNGWLFAFLCHKVVTTGVGPFTHVFTFEQATRIAPVTTIYFEDAADIKYKMQDLTGVTLTISGTERGPLAATLELIGSGRNLDGSMVLPALAAQTLLLGSDTDVLIGAPGAGVSIKERVRSWQVQLSSGAVHHRAPGGGQFSSMAKIGLQRATVQLSIAAKNVDDIRTLHLNDTLQELKVNTNSGAAAQLNLEFPNLFFKAPELAVDGIEEIWNVTADEIDVLKGAALDLFKATAINSIASYLVAA